MKFLERLMDWESTVYFIGAITGLGVISYIASSWFLTFWNHGNYAVALIFLLVGILLAGLALIRSSIALIAVFGGAIVSVTALFSGHLDLLLP
ncbi:hypothetical protein [Pseudoduganella danionis]|uniref:hypothetical protein n=1 Tax=Pseudoduganella danionis TaxID=1890295 RepID=UPI0035B1A27D